MNELAKEIAKEIIDQMSDEDKENFDPEDWREGIGNMDYPWESVTVNEILNAIEELLS